MNHKTAWINDHPHILLIDDDKRLQKLISTLLQRHGCLVTVASDADEAFTLMHVFRFDMMIVDVMLGKDSGFHVVNTVREHKTAYHTPLLMLSALGDTEHRIKGLGQGADDYLSKPFEPEELLLRLSSLWRRSELSRHSEKQASLPCVGDFLYDVQRSLLTGQNGHDVTISPQEKIVLDLLLTHQGQPVKREDLQMALSRNNSDADSGDNRSLDIYITRLRRKIEIDPKIPRHLLTIRGEGYKLI